MLGQIFSTMVHAGPDRRSMAGKLRQEMAQTQVDVDREISVEALAALRGISGVPAVSYLPQVG